MFGKCKAIVAFKVQSILRSTQIKSNRIETKFLCCSLNLVQASSKGRTYLDIIIFSQWKGIRNRLRYKFYERKERSVGRVERARSALFHRHFYRRG